MTANKRILSDKRLVEARKQYRAQVKAGHPERDAWVNLKATLDTVRAEARQFEN